MSAAFKNVWDLQSATLEAMPPEATTADRLVLAILLMHARPDGTSIYPACASICAKAGLTARSVFRSLARLRGWGFVEHDGSEEPRRGANRRTPLRRINVDVVMRTLEEKRAAASQHDPSVRGGMTPESGGGMTPESSKHHKGTPEEGSVETKPSLRAPRAVPDKGGRVEGPPKEAVRPESLSAVDLKDLAWSEGRDLLERYMSPQRAGSALGQLLRLLRDDKVRLVRLLRECRETGTQDPLPWLMAAARRSPSARVEINENWSL